MTCVPRCALVPQMTSSSPSGRNAFGPSCQATASMTLVSCSRPGRCRLSAAEPPTGEDPMDTVTGPPAPCAGQPCPQFSLAAIILAGGAAARLHGADKPALEVGGGAMLVSGGRAPAGA